MTDQEKALVRRDLALCLKLNTKLGDYRNLNRVQKMTAFSRQAANAAKQMSATAKDHFNMEKLQTNPEVMKAMEKGQEQIQLGPLKM